MKARNCILVAFCVVALVAAALASLGWHQSLYGLISQKCFVWEEEAFIGRPLSELESSLTHNASGLVPADADSLFAATHKTLERKQRVMYFAKGEKYNWFGYGIAINIGYVIIENDGDVERIVTIIRGRSVDGL